MTLPAKTASRLLATLAVAAALTTATACFQKPAPPTDEQIRENSAQATRELKAGAKVAAENAGTVAKQAAKGLGAVAAGVHDGLKGDSSGTRDDANSDRVDINSASEIRLAMLPGISITKAHDIAQGRPYSSTRALVRKGLLTRQQYDRIANRITAR